MNTIELLDTFQNGVMYAAEVTDPLVDEPFDVVNLIIYRDENDLDGRQATPAEIKEYWDELESRTEFYLEESDPRYHSQMD